MLQCVAVRGRVLQYFTVCVFSSPFGVACQFDVLGADISTNLSTNDTFSKHFQLNMNAVFAWTPDT